MLPFFCRLYDLTIFSLFLQFSKVIFYAKNFWSRNALRTGKGNKHVFNMLPITQYGAACVVQCVRNALHISIQYLPPRIAREKIMHGSSEVQPCYQYLHLENKKIVIITASSTLHGQFSMMRLLTIIIVSKLPLYLEILPMA